MPNPKIAPAGRGNKSPSFLILKKKLNAYFDENICVVDYLNANYFHELHQGSCSKRQPKKVVLVGGILARLLCSQSWPSRHYQLWVLCNSAKQILIEVLGIPPCHIGVVPRYALFPLKKSLRMPRLDEPMTFVFGGRMSRIKGIFHMLEFVHCLQNKHGLEARLVFSGSFDEIETVNENCEPWSTAKLARETKLWTDSLSWRNYPEIVTGLKPAAWVKRKYENPIFLSFSHLTHEDFGVSLAQAQALGWPAVLSSWGAHFDAAQKNTFYSPPFSLFASRNKIKKEASGYADEFVATLREGKYRIHHSETQKESAPKTLTPGSLDAYVRRAESNYPGIVVAAQNGFKNFLSTKEGKRLFKTYHRVFSNKVDFKEQKVNSIKL